MEPPLHPDSAMDDLLESYLNRHARPVYPIYTGVLVMIVAAVGALPLVHVDVSVRSGGVIRPVTEKHEVRSPTSAFAEAIFVQRGESIRQGQRLLVLARGELRERSDHLKERESEVRRRIADLEILATARAPQFASASRLTTPEYRQELTLLQAEFTDQAIRREQAAAELHRLRALHSRDLVSAAEVESAEYAHRSATAGTDLLIARHVTRWSADLARLRLEQRELRSSAVLLAEEQVRHVVEAPVGGTIEQILSVSPGAFLAANEVLAVISPDAPLRAEIFVASKDVGLLSVGMPVRLAIDAYNHFDWGHVHGRVTRISSDLVILEQQPAFRVEAELDHTYLQLPSGTRGELRKGMSLQAHFLLARRSLLQLLRDRVADWIEAAPADGLPLAGPARG